MLFLLNLGHFVYSVVTSITFGSNPTFKQLPKIQNKSPKKMKKKVQKIKISFKVKIQKKSKKIKKKY